MAKNNEGQKDGVEILRHESERLEQRKMTKMQYMKNMNLLHSYIYTCKNFKTKIYHDYLFSY